MTKAIRIHANGGPEVLRYEDITLAPLGQGQARVRHTAIGVNFSDVNVRRGGFYLNQKPVFPVILGNEAAGVVESVGPGVTDVKVGDRVVYAAMHGEFYDDTGAYSETRNVFADRLVKIPDGVSDQQAAAIMLKGLTASLIINKLFKPKRGDTVLIHTAASGVGVILCQWSKHLGATVIGTVGSPAKADIARAHGCDHTILYRDVDFVEETNKLVPGGVSVVFDGVGKDTFVRSLGCVMPFGAMVNYGNASGQVPPFELLLLARKSITISRPGFSSYTRDVPTMRAGAAELFDLVRRGVLTIEIGLTFPLKDAAEAHRALEGRKSAGSILLVP
ncbi:MAG: quinone oxidoreductase family protein [Xanthobacteraceae bacterium]